jgi:hypothetical protein
MKTKKTVGVSLQRKGDFETPETGTIYTFITYEDIPLNSLVVVPLAGNLKVGKVVVLHDQPKDTNPDLTYQEVMGVVSQLEGEITHV